MNDEDEDPDVDGVINRDEARLGLNPRHPDSDGDGWDDSGEMADGTNPADSGSRPRLQVATVTASFLNAVPVNLPAGTRVGVDTRVASFLNAMPAGLPTGTRLDVGAVPVSYLNALPEALPPGLAIRPQSAVVSHLNALPDRSPAGLAVRVHSPAASYLNALPTPVSGTVDILSPVVSYDNP